MAYWIVGSVAVIVPVPKPPAVVARIVAPLTTMLLVSPLPAKISSPPDPGVPPTPALIPDRPALVVPVSVQVPVSCLVRTVMPAAPVSEKLPAAPFAADPSFAARFG